MTMVIPDSWALRKKAAPKMEKLVKDRPARIWKITNMAALDVLKANAHTIAPMMTQPGK